MFCLVIKELQRYAPGVTIERTFGVITHSYFWLRSSVCNYVHPDSSFNWQDYDMTSFYLTCSSDTLLWQFFFTQSIFVLTCQRSVVSEKKIVRKDSVSEKFAPSHAPTFGPLVLFLGRFYTCVECVDLIENYIKADLRNQGKINPPDAWKESAFRLRKSLGSKSTHV